MIYVFFMSFNHMVRCHNLSKRYFTHDTSEVYYPRSNDAPCMLDVPAHLCRYLFIFLFAKGCLSYLKENSERIEVWFSAGVAILRYSIWFTIQRLAKLIMLYVFSHAFINYQIILYCFRA